MLKQDSAIYHRKNADQKMLTDAFLNIASVIQPDGIKSTNDATMAALEQIISYYGFTPCARPITELPTDKLIDYMLRPTGIMKRTVHLPSKWYKDAAGAMLSQTNEGQFVALLPKKTRGYYYFDRSCGKKITLNKNTEKNIEADAICFYCPLPPQRLSVRDLLLFIIKLSTPMDYLMIALATVATTLVGMLIPLLNSYLFGKVVVSGDAKLLVAVATMLISASISTIMISVMKALLIQQIIGKTSIPLEAAVYMRVLKLPASAFHGYMAGDLAGRVTKMNDLCKMLFDTVFSLGLSSVFSLAYIVQMLHYAPMLALPSLLIIIVNVFASAFISIVSIKNNRDKLHASATTEGVTYSLFSGVKKIKLTASENRAFAKWCEIYKKEATFTYNPPKSIVYGQTVTLAISLTGALLMYALAADCGLTVADYYAFNSCYGMVAGAFSSLITIITSLALIRPILELADPFLKTIPENMQNVKQFTKLDGEIEFSEVSFRYGENTPYVFQHLSFRVESGQYIAIVGKTGCGKSTILRLLLGFEKPQKGSIFFDQNDIATVDLQSLRRNIGTVTQDSKLFAGSIYENIVISAPWMTLEEAWDAAELAGIKEDIENLPMGMHTYLGEDGGGLSGGQKQRIMIARAIAPKPRVLIFDEATSALDNITQKKISEALDKMNCTRIVIAHRLSTIKQCDRILVIDSGQIIEDGTFDKLVSNHKFFAELVARQQLDK